MKYLVQRTGLDGHGEMLVAREDMERLLRRDIAKGYAVALGDPRNGYELVRGNVETVLQELDRRAAAGEARVLLLPQVVGG